MKCRAKILMKEFYFFTETVYRLVQHDAGIQPQEECSSALGNATFCAYWTCLHASHLPKPASPPLQAPSPNSHHIYNGNSKPRCP